MVLYCFFSAAVSILFIIYPLVNRFVECEASNSKFSFNTMQYVDLTVGGLDLKWPICGLISSESVGHPGFPVYIFC